MKTASHYGQLLARRSGLTGFLQNVIKLRFVLALAPGLAGASPAVSRGNSDRRAASLPRLRPGPLAGGMRKNYRGSQTIGPSHYERGGPAAVSSLLSQRPRFSFAHDSWRTA